LGRLARMHNNANVISLPGRFVTPDMARLIVDAWLTATFEAGRHVPRLAAVAAYETTRQIPQS
jgi:ribose 5-phosphate isomerase B